MKVTSSRGRFRGILFDFDGVLADTMDDNYRAWARAFAEKDISLGRLEYLELEGMNARSVARTLAQKYSLPESDAEGLAKAKERHYLRDNRFKLYPEVPRLLSRLRQRGYRMALVTGGARSRLQSTLDPAFLEQFAIPITGDDVLNSKPHPEPYVRGCQALELSPDLCLAVENAPLGVASAKAAGLSCVALTTTLSAGHLHEADWILDNLSGLMRILGEEP